MPHPRIVRAPNRTWGACVLFAFCTLLGACGAPQPEPRASLPDFTGFITAVGPGVAARGVGELALESHADKLVTRVRVTIGAKTFVGEDVGDQLLRRGSWTLARGQWVQVWFAQPGAASGEGPHAARQVVVWDPGR